jgi:hypothetical protein
VVWANGSLINLPFDEAREESIAIIEHLKKGGRWIELAYPHERWVREGKLPFQDWGKRTDGERTPWVEWYDLEKLKLRLHPWRLLPILQYRHESDSYVWLDCQVHDRHPSSDIIPRRAVTVKNEAHFAPGPIWTYAWSMPLGPSPAGPSVTVEIDCTISRGTVGFILWNESENRFHSREVILEARTGTQRLYLTTAAYDPAIRLLTRSATALGGSEYNIELVELRLAI